MTNHSFTATVQSESSPADFNEIVPVGKNPHAGCVFTKRILYLKSD